MSSSTKARLAALEQRQPVAGVYAFKDYKKIPLTAEIRARFKALYEPQGGNV